MTPMEKAYLFCSSHVNKHIVQYKTFEQFPPWWDCLGNWDLCYDYLVEKEYVRVTELHIEQGIEIIKQELAKAYKEESKGRQVTSRLPESFFKSKEGHIKYLFKKKVCLKYFKSQYPNSW